MLDGGGGSGCLWFVFLMGLGGRTDRSGFMCPGGRAEEGTGRVCRGLQVDWLVHLVMKAISSPFLSWDSVLWCFALGQFEKQYPLICHLMQMSRGRRWSIDDLPKTFA